MVNLVAAQKPLLHGLMKLAGVVPHTVGIDAGTVMNIWIPQETLKSDKTTTSAASLKPTKPVVVLVHGFAGEGIVTWQFQVGSLTKSITTLAQNIKSKPMRYLPPVLNGNVGLSDASKEDDRGHGPFGIFSFNRVDRWAQPLTVVDINEGRNFTMSWNDFFKVYELLQQKMIQRETLDDIESREFRPVLRTGCSYEMQVSELYTKEIFMKFQEEVALMSGCFSVTQIHVNGLVITYMVKERDGGGDAREANNFEVVHDKVGMEVRCICCFSFRGYLCRHALAVRAEEIPGQYILTRWRKDIKRLYIPDVGSNNIDISNPVQAFRESLNKARLAAEKPV